MITSVSAPAEGGSVRPTPRLWLAAAAEVAAAVGLAALVMGPAGTSGTAPHDHLGMAGMPAGGPVPPHWSAATMSIGVLTVGALTWWVSTRNRVAALVTAAGLTTLTTTAPVRSMVVGSHLVAMAALEILAVAVPMLLIAAMPRSELSRTPQPTRSHTAAVVIAAAGYSALLIALHLPVVHQHAGRLATTPLWPLAAAAVGFAYWAAILTTGGGVGSAIRRRALIVGQEVGAILGLAAIISPDSRMGRAGPLGMSAASDHRLGGLLMLITCAAVTLPLLKTFDTETQLRPDGMVDEH